jgi:anti-sigma B factor antagonist
VPRVTENDSQDTAALLEDISPPGHAGRLVLRVKSDLTAMTWRKFKIEFDRLLTSGCTHIRLDLSQVKFVDSAGISLLTLVNGALLERDGGLRLSSVPDAVKAALHTTRVDLLITIDGGH